MFTDLEKKQRGPAVFLSLTGRTRECVRPLGAEEISKETEVKSIIEQLDKIFLKDSDTRAYIAFKKLYNYRRMSGVNITDFVVQFDQLYHKLTQLDMKLPDDVSALFLLRAANVSKENEKLARATCKKLTYTDMHIKTTILKIFVDPEGEDEAGSPAMKQGNQFSDNTRASLTEEDLIKEEVEDVVIV